MRKAAGALAFMGAWALGAPLGWSQTAESQAFGADDDSGAEAMAAGKGSGPPTAERPLRCFIMDPIVQKGIEFSVESAAGLLTKRLAQLTKMKQFSFISSQEAAKMVELEAMKQATGAESDETLMLKVGEALKADRVITATVGKAGDAYMVNVVLMDIGAAKAERRLTRVLQGGQEKVIPAIGTLGDDLLAYLIKTYVRKAPGQGPIVPASSATSPAGKYTGYLLTGLGLGMGIGAAILHATASGVSQGAAIGAYAGAGAVTAAGVVVIAVSPRPRVIRGGSGDDWGVGVFSARTPSGAPAFGLGAAMSF